MNLSEAHRQAYLSIGSNISDRGANIARSVDCLKRVAGVNVTKVSSLYETEPVGYADQQNFYNCAVEIETSLSPENLLAELQRIENDIFKRKRDIRWGPRVIDLDIILFGSLIVDSLELKIPHPEMCSRLFVLAPLEELSPDLIHPVTGKSLRDILKERSWSEKVVKIKGDITA